MHKMAFLETQKLSGFHRQTALKITISWFQKARKNVFPRMPKSWILVVNGCVSCILSGRHLIPCQPPYHVFLVVVDSVDSAFLTDKYNATLRSIFAILDLIIIKDVVIAR